MLMPRAWVGPPEVLGCGGEWPPGPPEGDGGYAPAPRDEEPTGTEELPPAPPPPLPPTEAVTCRKQHDEKGGLN